MFSLQTPKSIPDNRLFRAWILGRAAANRRNREHLLERCRHDPLFYINSFAWTFNPRSRQKVLPFVTWDFQDRAIGWINEHIDKQRDGVIEKSRDMGASWICLAVFEHRWHFHGWNQFLIVSREGELVDGKTPDALFWKIDFLHQWLPEWLLPRLDRTKRYLENRDNGSTITGQATTEKIGIGGRATAILLDEFSRVDRDFEVRDGTADTADCRLFNSTHTGTGTAFYGLCTNGVTDKLVMHWSKHPEKARGLYRWSEEKKRVECLDPDYEFPADYAFTLDGRPAGGPCPGLRSPWYDGECSRRSERDVRTNLDIDVAGSMSQFFDALHIRRLIQLHTCDPLWRGDIEADAVSGRPIRLNRSPDGPLKLWLRPKGDCEVPSAPYTIGADVSAGTGATPSCLGIYNPHSGEKVGEYTHAHLDPKQFAVVSTALGWLFKSQGGEPAKLVWEHHGPGVSYGNRVLELGYGRVYYRSTEVTELLGGKISDKPGWVPQPDTILALLTDYQEALKTGLFINRSEPALLETLQFKYNVRGEVEHAEIANKDDPTGARKNHGDHVIADALAYKLGKEIGPVVQRKEEESLPVGSLAWRRAIHAAADAARSEW